jgi:hypothetical protein
MDGVQEARNAKARVIRQILVCSGLQYGSTPCGYDELPDSIEINFFMDLLSEKT